jgi:POT family proton-dependent oligopeptide transporter
MVIYTNRKVHPMALFVLFGAEMWERFSYYGMRALLTLFMAKVLFVEMGQATADSRALGIYGSYTSMVYLFPVVGGLIADRIFGFRKSIIWGGFVMVLGHASLALMGIPGLEHNLNIFFMGLAMIIVGNAFFKPNISSFLGEFYEKDDPRKDGAFSIFYMGINIGAFLSTLTCGYVGEKINWHYGFGLAGIGMTIGLIIFWLTGPKVFGEKGIKPNTDTPPAPLFKGVRNDYLVYLGTLIFLPVCAALHNFNDLMSTSLLVISIGMIGYLIYQAYHWDNTIEGKRLLVIVVLFFFHAVFWALFEQAGGSLTLFADRNVDREIFGSVLPASIIQSLNPFFIIILAPLFSVLWIRLRNAGKEPSTPMKFVLGLVQLGLGFLVIYLGCRFFAVDGLVSLGFVVVLYLLNTMGELSLSPVGLSMVTKLSPGKIVGFAMGFWFMSLALGNKLAGEIGKLTASESIPADAPATETLPIYMSTYLNWGVMVIFACALVLLVLVPTLRKWMGGLH